MLLAGKVLVDDTPIDKAGTQVRSDAVIRLRGADHPYVSRGGLKLAGALDDFGVEAEGLVCLDVGSSTGGFTDCLLRRGAKQVVAVDVGTHQLHNRLRQDPRVLSLEQTDIRAVETAQLPAPIDLVVVDASFISLRLLLPAIAALITVGTPVLALVKPQFEVGKSQVGKGGVVRDDALRSQAVDGIAVAAETLGFAVEGRAESHLAGARSGNREVFLMVRLSPQ